MHNSVPLQYIKPIVASCKIYTDKFRAFLIYSIIQAGFLAK